MASALSPLARWTLVLVATSTMAVSYVDRQAVSALAPTITADLQISDAEYGWLGSAFSFSYLIFTPIAGLLIDRVGARKGLLTAVLLWSLVAASHALVPGFTALFLLRILLGCTEAPSFPGAAQTISRVLPPERHSLGFGILFTGSSVGAALSAVIAPTLANQWGWRVALLGTAVVGLCWVPLWIWRSGGAARELLDQREEREHFRWGGLLKETAVLRAVAAVLASAPIVGLVLQFGAKLLVADQGLAAVEVRDYLWVPPLIFDGGSVLFGYAAAGRPKRWLFGIAALLAGCIGLLDSSRTAWQATAAMSLAMAGGGGIYALATSEMLSRVPKGQVAAAGGITAAAQSLALIIAFPLIGQAVGNQHSYGEVGWVLALWSIPGALIWLALSPKT